MKWLLNGCGSKGAARFREPIWVLLETHYRNLLGFSRTGALVATAFDK
jgi:hypothetical protein